MVHLDEIAVSAKQIQLELLPERLQPGGYGIFEGGSEQMEPLRIFASGMFRNVTTANDLYGKPRFLIVQN